MEQLWVRTDTAQQQPNAAGVAQHHRTDPQPGQADVVRASNGQRRVAKRQAAQSLHQRIGQNRQQRPELIGPELATGRPISKDIHLLILDPVLHVSTGAVQLGVEIPIRLLQVGHHEARVGPKRTGALHFKLVTFTSVQVGIIYPALKAIAC